MLRDFIKRREARAELNGSNILYFFLLIAELIHLFWISEVTEIVSVENHKLGTKFYKCMLHVLAMFRAVRFSYTGSP